MINRLPLTVGFARVSQITEDQGNLETQTQQLQDYGVHELVTEIGSGARSDRRALRDLQARLQAGDTLVVTAIDRIIQGQERARAEGKRIGRPPALTPEARQEVEKKLREGQSVNRIAQVHHVHHSVIRRVAQELDDVDA